jgi:methylmalonyl-CoA mutase
MKRLVKLVIFSPGSNMVDAAGEVLKLLGHNLPPAEEESE